MNLRTNHSAYPNPPHEGKYQTLEELPVNRSPGHSKRDKPRCPPQQHIPTLQTTLRTIRDHLELSRITAYERHGISPSYLSQIERGDRTPSIETLEAIIAGYGLTPMQARHIRELRTPAEVLAPVEKLRQCVSGNIGLTTHIQDLEERRVLAAAVDPMWNVLACNESFRSLLPGLDETDCIPRWLFSPIAQTVLVQWHHEAAHSVATIKAVLGRYRGSRQAHDLIRQLRPNKEFQRLWNCGIDVAYGRDTNDLIHRRDPMTREFASYRLSIADATQAQNVLLITAIRKPYSGSNPADR
ncbi:helix-turn-helix domain-containing protein [Nocardia sp. NPDC051990]|uniref:helix-turn-helix domain-containing protein n=1 Tax=Nocardia sp. NPDC051990 TaxID=3155285 RepID=UPI003449AA08